MEENGVKKLAGSGVFHGGAGNKALSAEAAMALMRQIRKTAVSIADAEDTPEFDDKFVLPRSNAFEGVLASVRTFLSEATPHSALFIDFKMPADFLAKLQAIIDRMEKAATDKDDGLLEQVGGTAKLAKNSMDGMKARKQLLTLVSNTYAGSGGTLAEWKTASHIIWPQSGGDASPPAPEQPN
ncbi:MAG: hypothetical protein H7Y36_04080 [Armatimonadetes bacterium]|nr:hypothetical protein [Akkermansiaceae bacterium]